MQTIEQRVANGIRWLNENFPGWRDRIDLETLEMKDGFKCICGQVFGNENPNYTGYNYAYLHLFQEANSWITPLVNDSIYTRPLAVSIILGFSLPDDPNESFKMLEDEWKRQLTNG